MRNDYLDLIIDEPVEIAHALGFRDMTDLHNDWLKQMILSEDDRTLLAHRGSYKTTCLTVSIGLLMLIHPKKNIIFLRKTDDDVMEVIRQVGNMLESPLFNHLCNKIYGSNLEVITNTAFKIDTNLSSGVKGAVQLLGMGVNGSLTGKHADIVITDDIVNIKDRVSRAEREHTKLIYMELQNVKNRGGRFINTGTPWHKDDCISIMPNVQKYDCYSTGLIGRDMLNSIRQTMTPSLFAANYELKHIADEDALFGNPQFFKDANLLKGAVCHIDASYGGADATAFTMIKQDGEKFYVLGKRREKHVDDCLHEFYGLQDLYKAGTIYCEKNGDKEYLAKEMRKDGKIVKSYSENMNKYIKISTYLRKNWLNIVFYEDTDAEYLNEILDYTENAQHDDSPDSLASIIRELTAKGKWLY